MSDYTDNYMTDEKNVHWVKMDYVNPIMKKTDRAMDKLTADNKALRKTLKKLHESVCYQLGPNDDSSPYKVDYKIFDEVKEVLSEAKQQR
jgi:hypothetical protein